MSNPGPFALLLFNNGNMVIHLKVKFSYIYLQFQEMAGMSKFVESLPEGYGYVIFSAVGSQFVAMWMAINVGKARKKYEVEVFYRVI